MTRGHGVACRACWLVRWVGRKRAPTATRRSLVTSRFDLISRPLGIVRQVATWLSIQVTSPAKQTGVAQVPSTHFWPCGQGWMSKRLVPVALHWARLGPSHTVLFGGQMATQHWPLSQA